MCSGDFAAKSQSTHMGITACQSDGRRLGECMLIVVCADCMLLIVIVTICNDIGLVRIMCMMAVN